MLFFLLPYDFIEFAWKSLPQTGSIWFTTSLSTSIGWIWWKTDSFSASIVIRLNIMLLFECGVVFTFRHTLIQCDRYYFGWNIMSANSIQQESEQKLTFSQWIEHWSEHRLMTETKSAKATMNCEVKQCKNCNEQQQTLKKQSSSVQVSYT